MRAVLTMRYEFHLRLFQDYIDGEGAHQPGTFVETVRF